MSHGPISISGDRNQIYLYISTCAQSWILHPLHPKTISILPPRGLFSTYWYLYIHENSSFGGVPDFLFGPMVHDSKLRFAQRDLICNHSQNGTKSPRFTKIATRHHHCQHRLKTIINQQKMVKVKVDPDANEYERQRLANIEKNKLLLKSPRPIPSLQLTI